MKRGATGSEESMGFRQIGGLALLCVGLVFILFGIYLNLQKPMYRAVARIKVAPETTAQIGAENGRITLTMSDPYLTQNVCEEIQSEPILTKVVEDLGLANEWGKRYNLVESPHRTAEIIAILKGKIGFRPIRNTMFLEIGCISERPEEAKEIANGVARAYQQFRAEQRQHGSLGGLKVLEARWKEQEEKVHTAQTNMDRLREQFNIQYSMAAADSPAMLLSAETLRKLEGMRIELEATVMQQETLLEKLKGMSRDKLIYALPTATPDALLNSLLEQRNYAEQALIVKGKDFGESHPEVVKLHGQVEDLKTKIDNQVDGILMNLNSRVSAVREQLNKLKDEVDKAKTNDIATARQTQPYWEAKRKLEDLRYSSRLIFVIKCDSPTPGALGRKTTELAESSGTYGKASGRRRGSSTRSGLFRVFRVFR